MNILVLAALAPFAETPPIRAGRALAAGLRREGHDAELMRVPYDARDSRRLADSMLIWRSLRLDNVSRVIALGFPACLVAFPAKIAWMDALPEAAEARPALRAGLAEAQGRFAFSSDLAARLRAEHDLEADILPPPDAGWDATIATLLA